MNLSENEQQQELRSPAEKTARIRELNDDFRRGLADGIVLLTAGVKGLPSALQERILNRVRSFDEFNADNDPHQEHDFGAFEIHGVTYFWKLDLYEQPGVKDADGEPVVTRVLTIMLAEDY